MATSGTVKATGSTNGYFWVSWSNNTQVYDASTNPNGDIDPINNRTRIHWSCGAYLVYDYYLNAVRMNSVTINGTTVYSTTTYSYLSSGNHTFGSGEMWISHDSDGTKTFTIGAVSGWLYGSGDYSASATNWTLNTIDRNAPSVTLSSLSNITADGFTISATSNTTCNNWQYKLNSGSWQTLDSGSKTSVSKVLTGLSPATSYTVTVKATRTYNGVPGTSGSSSITTLGGAVIVSTLPINIDVSQEVKFNATFYNAGYVNKLAIMDDDEVVIDETSIGTHAIGQNVPVTWTLTQSEQEEILGYLYDTNSKVLQLAITSYDSGSLIGGGNSVNITFNIVDSFPVLDDFTYEDTNSDAIDVSEDDQTLIQNQSILSINDLDATAQNGAFIESWKYEIGQQSKTGYPTSGTYEFGTVSAFGDLVLTVTAIDTRGNSASKQVSIQTLRYVNISVDNYYLHRTNNVEEEVNLTLSGKYTMVGTNSLQSSRWRYREQGTPTWSAWQTLDTTETIGGYSFDDVLGDLDSKKNFEVYIEFKDKLTTTYFISTVLKGLYLMMFRDGYVGINTNEPEYDLDIQPKETGDENFLRAGSGVLSMTDAQWQELYDDLGLTPRQI